MKPGIHLSRMDRSCLSQEKLSDVLKLPYRLLIGSLMYVAIGTRPDIAFAIQQLSQFLDCFASSHWTAAKQVMCYLKGTCQLQLHLGGWHTAVLTGFTNTSYQSCPDTCWFTSGYCFSLGSGIVSWASQKQKTVSTSICEAEYVAGVEAVKKGIWLHNLLSCLHLPQPHPSPIMCNNTGTLVLSTDPSFYAKVKHIDMKYHFIHETIHSGKLALSYISILNNVADAFTKALPTKQFLRLHSFMGLLWFYPFFFPSLFSTSYYPLNPSKFFISVVQFHYLLTFVLRRSVECQPSHTSRWLSSLTCIPCPDTVPHRILVISACLLSSPTYKIILSSLWYLSCSSPSSQLR